MTDLRYPIGQFQAPDRITEADVLKAVDAIAALPGELRAAVSGLDDRQLDTPYRPEGWTVRQLVHHVADSHMHSYIRMKLGATAREPSVNEYDEKIWAETVDARHSEPDTSLALIESLHRRWSLWLRSLDDAGWQRKFVHPKRGPVPLSLNALIYAWHGKHHVAHITALRERMRW
jgi:hypothetical protein